MQLFEKKIVDIVHQLFMEYVHEGDIVIDATAGGVSGYIKIVRMRRKHREGLCL